MLQALEQAWLGRGICAPNPSVGAVVVSGDKTLAKSYHKGTGKPHAEQLILQQLGDRAKRMTLYVSLEPCNHWGRTPPCVEGIIAAGISKVVYAFSDPNPVVAANQTPSILRDKGIEVIHFPMPEIDLFYQSYRLWVLTGKPWITSKMAQSLDGKIAGISGQRLHLSNDACARFTHQQRLYTDIILTSARTIRQDEPRFDVRLDEIRQKKPLAILDSRLGLSENARVFTSAQHCHIYHDKRYKVSKPIKNCSYHPVSSIDEKLDLSEVIYHLGTLGYHDVWVEAGGRLFSALHEAQLVDTTFLYIVPKVLGETATSGYHGDQIFKRKHRISWESKADNMLLRLDWLEDKCLPE